MLAAEPFAVSRNERVGAGAMLLMTVTLTLPVAGSAIFILDPYLTARSFSTPLTLFAIAYALERRMLVAALCLLAAFILHPLMASYAVGYVIVLALVRARRWRLARRRCLGVMVLGFAASHAGICWVPLRPIASPPSAGIISSSDVAVV